MSGWEPSEVTTYEYDDEGRILGSVTVRESEWSSVDRQSLLAYLEASRVGAHGHPMEEATSPLADPSNVAREWEYVTPPPTRDFARASMKAAQDAYQARYPDTDMGALLWRVERRDL